MEDTAGNSLCSNDFQRYRYLISLLVCLFHAMHNCFKASDPLRFIQLMSRPLNISEHFENVCVPQLTTLLLFVKLKVHSAMLMWRMRRVLCG